ncbi:metallophosphoesterase [Roseovarius ramblicola]|uniref:Metallophosphoesterase n=1 Tax=Roseovarius ramblicola TaxID=2022336 RepID=A0ABV5HYE3_9RHOB
MKTVLKKFFNRRDPAPDRLGVREEPLRPERSFVAIGDVHGRADLLREIDGLVSASCAEWPVVFLGDYVDRGEESREVLELLMSVPSDREPPVTCLMGNHERMLLDFLDRPEQAGPRWLRNGGLQTLAGFGIAPPMRERPGGEALCELRERLSQAMGGEMIAWLRARPLTWSSGNVWAVHAAADPDLPMAEQTADTLLWGHAAFHRQPRADGQWVVHGHTVVAEPQARAGRVAVDTGAYATGRLSAALITRDGAAFLQTGRD